MQALADAVVATTKEFDAERLRDAARKWAAYSLDTFRADFATKALAISVSIIDFADTVAPPPGKGEA